MTDIGNDRDEVEQRTPGRAATTQAWERTLEDIDALAETRTEEGWDVIQIAAGSTSPTPPSVRDDGRFGPVFVIPDNKAEPFERAFEEGTFPLYEVYRETVDDTVFLVVEYRDPETSTVILVAGTYELRNAAGMANAAMDEETIYTRVQTLDGTVLGTCRHDNYEKFVPDIERVANWHDRDTAHRSE